VKAVENSRGFHSRTWDPFSCSVGIFSLMSGVLGVGTSNDDNEEMELSRENIEDDRELVEAGMLGLLICNDVDWEDV
jgi:hypothetical protein